MKTTKEQVHDMLKRHPEGLTAYRFTGCARRGNWYWNMSFKSKHLPKVGDYVRLAHNTTKLGHDEFFGLECRVLEQIDATTFVLEPLTPFFTDTDTIRWSFAFGTEIWEFEYLTRDEILAYELQQ